MMNFNERRQHIRVEIDYVTVEVYPSSELFSSPEVSDICSVLNLSENGMGFSSDKNYEPGRLLRLTFVLPDSMVIIRTNAIAIHSRQKNDNSYEIGVQFKNLGIAERKIIKHVIEKMLSESKEI